MAFRVVAVLKNVLFPGDFAHINQQIRRKPDNAALFGFLLRNPEARRDLVCSERQHIPDP